MSRVQLLSKNNTAASVNNDGVKSRLPQKKARKVPLRVHIVCGDIMMVTNKMVFDHDVQYANRKILEWIDDPDVVDRKLVGTCASDYSNLDKWLKHAHILISYSSGPIADEENTKVLQQWLENGGRMIGIHGTSGGYARKITSNDEFKNALYPGKVHKHGPREWMKKPFHDTLGAFFMAHPPIHTFPVDVIDTSHTVTKGLPERFDLEDELYLFELQGDLKDYKILVTTDYDIMGNDMRDSNYAYLRDYPWDPKRDIKSLQRLYEKNARPFESEMLVTRDPGEYNTGHPAIGKGNNNKRVLVYERKVGKGAVCYIGLGHCTVNRPGHKGYKGSWANPIFEQMVKNAITWAADQ